MKAYKFEVLVIDFDQLGGDEIARTIQEANYPNDCIDPRVESVEERDIGEWTDDHPLNKAGSSLEYTRLFGNNMLIDSIQDLISSIEKYSGYHWEDIVDEKCSATVKSILDKNCVAITPS